ncbi:MAG: glucuronosyltransferase [Candidatus Diapherotrites archaeon]|nr:glucuronosyltransferase [Candidatus Diapherotrites archaeon]
MEAEIFVVCGTHSQGFGRLVRAADLIARKKKYRFFAQTGNTEYRPQFMAFSRFLEPDQMKEKMLAADLIVCHGGAGIIGPALQNRKKTIIVPRRRERGEHTDNHQVELAQAAFRQFHVPFLENENELEAKIEKELESESLPSAGASAITGLVRAFIEKTAPAPKNI